MTIPLVHTTVAGLYLSETHVVWAAGTRLGRRLRQLLCESEPVEDGDIQAALRRLVERVRPGRTEVVTHLGPLHVRHAVLQGPTFDDAASFEAWLQAETARYLPPRANNADFVLRIQLLEQTEEYTRCLLALASRKAVEERAALLEEVGLQVVGIGTIDVAMGEALTLDPGFVERPSAVLFVRPDDAALLQYQEGLLQSLVSLPYGVRMTDTASLLEEAAAHLTPAPGTLFVIGTEAKHVADEAREARLIDGLVQEAALDFLPQAQQLPALHVPAAALALQYLFPAPDALNFLEPEVVQTRLQEAEKREATRAVLTLGSIVGLLLLILTVITVSLDGRYATAEAELLVLADQVERIERAHEAVRQLEQDIAQAERLVVERTDVVRVLESIGRVVSEELWLDGVTLAEGAQGTPHLTLTGAAFNESAIATYLHRLEQTAFARDVRLLVSESVRTTALYKQARVQDRTLTRFEIQLEITSLSHDHVEASP